MSSFNCEYCGELILDTASGYVTKCEHYPNKPMNYGQIMRHREWLKTLKRIDERIAPKDGENG